MCTECAPENLTCQDFCNAFVLNLPFDVYHPSWAIEHRQSTCLLKRCFEGEHPSNLTADCES